ncbi:ABC transporter substrate-binding protein [Tepidimicrobium xylanilyticum]|uniref:Putative spermidine/putrescine transport system substrate-binding protein n=1 Tax=Tepidimicrobium xylanilyticum TaxID=1123352 RepID=A0A1H2PZG2_9FIRM|nr:ABC transporter substrate-binding protein [Tepidimicrobium xylanilyticum]GMG95805.1 ABC transporter substrate-binding protein [Tepidimicrobium xylanilyticum]SDW00220.1 putative spermidine/putrescine transport system substrate-binding protein [Tepidimicrobium xylanilyticum]
MKKKSIAIFMIMILVFGLTGCKEESTVEYNLSEKDWDTILEEARGTTVTIYGYGGDQKTNNWIDTYVASELKERYDITLNRVGMNIDDILNNLLNEKQANVESGNMDVVWINGENFFTAKQNDLLFGPFTDKLPNFHKYVDTESVEVNYDFGYPVEGYEAPFGKAQFVMIYNSAKVDKVPRNHKELMEFCKNNPGKFTYPAPPDFTGSAFVRNIIYDIVGYEQFMDMEADEEVIKEAIQPAIDYFVELKPYLWKEGKTYPAEAGLLDNMYADNEVYMTMSYNPNKASGKIGTGEFPESTRTFLFDKGTIGNTHFLAIPYNAPNKSGALVAIDFILSVEAQVSKYVPETWGDLPVLDNNKLSEEEKAMFDNVKLGIATLPQDELLEKRLPEVPADLVPIIEKIWMESVPGESE